MEEAVFIRRKKGDSSQMMHAAKTGLLYWIPILSR